MHRYLHSIYIVLGTVSNLEIETKQIYVDACQVTRPLVCSLLTGD